MAKHRDDMCAKDPFHDDAVHILENILHRKLWSAQSHEELRLAIERIAMRELANQREDLERRFLRRKDQAVRAALKKSREEKGDCKIEHRGRIR